jgi:starch synthase
MNILMIASEAAPFAKVGGMGDVLASLPPAIAGAGADVRVMLPLYGSITEEWREQMTLVSTHRVTLAWRSVYCGLLQLKRAGVTWYFLDNEYYFKRREIYGHFDDGERYAFYSRAAAELALRLPGWRPDVIHCHDWQTALAPVYLREFFPEAADIKLVFTIHNIEYQGRFDKALLGDIFGLPESVFSSGALEFYGGLNLMKAAIELSDRVTTVSPTYAEELGYAFYAQGLEGVVNNARRKTLGILNGIDMELYNPAADPNVFVNYSKATIGKKKDNKRRLRSLLGLAPQEGAPLIVMISRLVPHKGIDLVAAALNEIMDMDVQFVVLGRGDWHYEQLFLEAAANYSGRFAASINYNESLAMKLYAGGDIILMPSRAEPCGLSQMIAMRYGTIPVAREMGGLRDTVSPYIKETKQGCGFTFANYNAGDMLYVLRQAEQLYREHPADWRALAEGCMERDFSWAEPARQYIKLYKDLLKKKKK